jgi:hypothetical protein
MSLLSGRGIVAKTGEGQKRCNAGDEGGNRNRDGILLKSSIWSTLYPAAYFVPRADARVQLIRMNRYPPMNSARIPPTPLPRRSKLQKELASIF